MRWIRNIFAVLACMCVVLWVVSYPYFLGIQIPLWERNSAFSVKVLEGLLKVRVDLDQPPNFTSDWKAWMASNHEIRKGLESSYSNYGVRLPWPVDKTSFKFDLFNRQNKAWTWRGMEIVFPLWLPTLLFALWPAIASARHIKRRYFTQHICRKCGYDLRATPTGICPECGHEQTVTKTV